MYRLVKIKCTIVLIAAVILVMLLCLSACSTDMDEMLIKAPKAGEVWDGVIQKWGTREESIQVPDYRQIWASEDAPSIRLWNPKENDVLFQYVIECQNKAIFTSGMIRPGSSVYFDVMGQFADPGEYSLRVKIYTFSEDQLKSYSGSMQDASLKIY